MSKQTKAIYRDMEHLAADAHELMAATADVAGEKVEAVRKRLVATLDHAKNMLHRAEDEAISRARTSAKCALDNPRQSLAIAVAAGAFIGCIVALACHRKGD